MSKQFKTKPKTYRVTTLAVHDDHPFIKGDYIEVAGNYLYVLRLISRTGLVAGIRVR